MYLSPGKGVIVQSPPARAFLMAGDSGHQESPGFFGGAEVLRRPQELACCTPVRLGRSIQSVHHHARIGVDNVRSTEYRVPEALVSRRLSLPLCLASSF